MFVHSLLCFYCLCSFLFLRNHFWISFIFCSCKTLLVLFPFFVSHLVHIAFFFRSCSFEQDKLTHCFWQKNHVFNSSKNLSFEFLLFDISKKSFIIFRFSYFSKSLVQKKKNTFFELLGKFLFLFFLVEKQYCSQRLLLQQKTILSRSHCVVINLFVFRKISFSPAFSEKVCFHYLLLVFFSFESWFSQKSPSKKWCSWEKENFFYLLLIFHFCWRNSFLFSNCPRNSFALVVFFFFFSAFSVLFFWCFYLFWSFSSPKNLL